ncbi:SIR2 family protein [Enhygromyxa salina]|uniref:CHAT domain protein n=1 Tax=Enhygromyxa salina TaxID=215803 RepID=A0A2S9XN81_9BACT|nr:SIR2 family protein [Enhygromyxa salina]PRP94312.1 CHAT domain protein [Enhygromyxa salina]
MSSTIDLQELRAHPTPLVVYVGHELSRAAGLPSRRELARALLDALPDSTPARRRRELAALVDAPDLADLFTELERDLTPARFGLVVERALRDDGLEPPPLARALASLGPRLQGIVTPNLDRLLERAFEARLVAHVRPSMGLLQRGGWLLKINGTLSERSSWVFTRDQRARVRHREPVHARVLRALVMAKPMLFVGTMIDDPIFDDVVAHVRDLGEGAPPRHWALVAGDQLTPATRAKLDDAGIAAISYDTQHEALDILASLGPEPDSVRSRPSPVSPPELLRRPASGPLRVLFVSANPRDLDSLAVDREQRVIRESIARAVERDRIELEVRVAACFADLSRALLEASFDLVHIAGHGEPLGILLDEGGHMHVPPAELAALFDEYAAPRGRLRCVVLNACWSADASQPISKVPTVISMNGPIDDRAALAFAEGFYDALGAGRDFAAAHREGERRARSSVPCGPFEALLSHRG